MKKHYTYLITYPDGKLYHGLRSCDCEISEDKYMGSSNYTPEDGVKVVMTTHGSREDASIEEIRYHKEHSVDSNETYYNRARATSTGFSTVVSGEDHPFYGKTHTKEVRDMLLKNILGNHVDKGTYTFNNKKTLETFTGTRVEFRSQFPEINFRNIDDAVRFLNWKIAADGSEFKGKRRHSVKGWIVSQHQ